MLRIRLTRTGKKGQPSFRVVVAEKSKAVKRKYLELLGHYLPAVEPKKIELNKERIEYWISQGAQPTDTVAALLKNNGFDGMDKYLEPRNKQRKKKGEQPEAPEGSSPAKEEAKAEGGAPAAEAGGEAPATEEAAPAEEAKKEEAPKEEPKAEDKPAEEAKEEAAKEEAAA